MSLYGGVRLVDGPDLDNIRCLHLLPVPCVQAMMRYGMAIDREWLDELTSELDKEIAELRIEICSYIPPEKLDEFIERSNMDAEDDYLPMNVESNVQMRKLLFEVLGVGAGKSLKLTKSGDISTGKRQLETFKKEYPVLRPVLKYRECSKIKGTYSSKLPRIARFHPKGYCTICEMEHQAETWRIHTEILSTRTATSRYASKNPNLQNIPARTVYGKKTRKGFVASPGTEITSVDFSQLQLRIFADRANASKMIWIFDNDKDPHTMTAAWSFGVEEHEVTKEQRDPSKNVNFAILFKESPPSVFEQLVSDSYGRNEIEVPDWLTQEWVDGFFRKWHGMYPEALEYGDRQDYRGRRYGYVWDMFGWTRRMPEFRSEHKKVIAEGSRKAGNTPIQSPDAGMMRLAMAIVWYEIKPIFDAAGIWFWPLMTIHDELLVEHEEGYGEIVQAYMIDAFERVMTDVETGEHLLRVPIRASGKTMERWSK